ncbi:MAG: UDP-N-acetylglucosamine--N-acetylmuramyl-(pentapeptide) pyrophosphoryl-undecaprenol N-acetylglucosamine transferase [Chlamydiales bacterium]|nr:UDP-N-acetylglucosamine--N-acetylmuramyl-(pentapeptide) pyrophosphoryl-undecaprenol N-acetylglucosamine transferase [Chlamydiales bacterium]
MSKRIVIAAGGTGGHLFPAQSLACELGDSEILFLAKGLKTNPRFNRDLYAYKDIASGPVSIKTLLFSSWNIFKGIVQSVVALKKFKPDAVIGFGSYHTFPVLCAAKILSIPIVLHEANSVPGKVNRIFSPYAVWTGVFFPEATQYLKGKVQPTDIPLRAEFHDNMKPNKKQAAAYYGLRDDATTVLVFGGSLGAKKLNELAAASICALDSHNLQVLHFTGSVEATKQIQEVYRKASIVAVVREFENQMPFAWALADVCVSRSGASSIAEAVSFTVPTVYVPYPYATDAHQDKNAQYIVDVIKGGLWYHESEVTCDVLRGAITRLLTDEYAQEMIRSLQNAKISMQSNRFSDLVTAYLGKNS